MIVALKYKDGSILASDTRVMLGEIKRDQARSLKLLTDDIGVAGEGLLGAIDDIMSWTEDMIDLSSAAYDDIFSTISDKSLEWWSENSEKVDEDETSPTFYVVSSERMRRISERGYSEEIREYECDGSGYNYGEYLLQKLYKKEIEEEEAKELAANIIIEASRIDSSVGEEFEMAVFRKGEKGKIVNREEIGNLKARLAPISSYLLESRIRILENIINLREEIDNLWEKKFGFKLLEQNEKAVFQITRPCRNENEFTNSIAALALLIDQINTREMKNFIQAQPGSINHLEEFLKKEIGQFPCKIIQNLRDIRIMRSKKSPIHPTDPKFFEAVQRITGEYKFPPNWFELYSKTLKHYEESLEELLHCLCNST